MPVIDDLFENNIICTVTPTKTTILESIDDVVHDNEINFSNDVVETDEMVHIYIVVNNIISGEINRTNGGGQIKLQQFELC